MAKEIKDPTIIQLPFSGFYESLWSGEIDSQGENYVEHYVGTVQGEEGIPPELRLDAAEVSEILFDVTDYGQCYRQLAEYYADAFNTIMSEHVGFPLGMTYESMDSPREYNFHTDRIYANVPQATVAKLFELSAADDHERLRAVLKERHTSRPGFHSWYSNDLDDWLTKPLDQWDHNELCSLILSFVPERFDGGDDLEMKCYYAVCDYDDGGYQAWERGVDWNKLDTKLAEYREEKLEMLREEAAGRGDPMPDPVYRCPETPDLFRGPTCA